MLDGADLARAAAMPPAEAVNFLRSKRMFISAGWRTVEASAHARGFTVANVTKLDALEAIMAEQTRALGEGLTLEQFKDQLIPRLTKKGWFAPAGQPVRVPEQAAAADPQTGELPTRKRLTGQRLETIFRVNMQSSMMAGRYRALMEDVDNRPWFQYVAVMDRRTRPAHAAMNGRVLRYDDPGWKTWWPPCGWKCRCRVRALSSDDLAERDLQPESSQGRTSEVDIQQRDGSVARVTRYDMPGGQTFAPDPGFNANPAQVQAADQLAVAKAPAVLGQARGDAELRKLFTARQRLGDAEAFARTARQAQQAGAKLGIGALDEAAAFRLADEGVTFDPSQPVRLDAELVNDQLGIEDWAQLPVILSYGSVYWDTTEQLLTYVGKAVAPQGERVMVHVGVRATAVGNEVAAARLATRDMDGTRFELVRHEVKR
ncbi:MAG: phage minor head protein [Rubrivivax sp.]